MGDPAVPTGRFGEVLHSLKSVAWPRDARVAEIPAPTRIAPFAIALEARIPGPGGELANGTFIVFHNPEPPGVWEGDVRIVTAGRADLDREMGEDPLMAEVAWMWLVEALDAAGPLPRALAGTVTKTLDESFGGLRPMRTRVGVEIRASWTPEGADAGTHLLAWLAFLGRLGGLEPLPEDVARLSAR